jgi:O-phosphoseryl-tRNA(Cys) synthetase
VHAPRHADRAGNRTEQAMTFATTTSTRDIQQLRGFLAVVSPGRVPDADIRNVLNRDARAVIDSIEGVATLPAVNALRG